MSRTPLSALVLLLASTVAAAQPPSLEVEISGISGDLLDNVRSSLSIYIQRDDPLLNDALIRRHHDNAAAEISTALEPFGYYQPEIESSLERVNGRWIAGYRITPGDPVLVGEVRLNFSGPGQTDPIFEDWRKSYPLTSGDILNHRTYESAKSRLRGIARDRGYIDGELAEHRVTVDLRTNRASIDMHYSTGPRYRFGEIDIRQEFFAEEFLRRYLTFRSGDPYEASQLLKLRRALTDSDYFDRIDVTPLFDDAEDGRIPVEIVLEPRKSNRYTAGLGYSTDTGARGLLGYEQRRANQYGHRYSATFNKSEIESSLTGRYFIPLKRPVTDTLIYGATWEDEETDTTDRTTASLGADISQQQGNWLRTVGLNYEWERFVISGIEERTLLLIPHIGWQRVKADQRINTQRGWIFSIDLRGASDSVISDISFSQVRVNGKYIRGISDRIRMLLRASSGLTWTPAFTELPTSQRFFSGGDQSVRGYEYNSLGPQDDQGNVIGGRNLLEGSLEFEYRILPRTSLAAFYDAGNAYNGDDINPEKGAGVGIRWQTPVGAVRLDFAQAVSRDDRPWRIHLTLGPDL